MNSIARLAMYSTHLSANDLKSLMNGVASFIATGSIGEAPKNEIVALALESICNDIIAEQKEQSQSAPETPEEKKARISKARSEAGKRGAAAKQNQANNKQNQANQANEAKTDLLNLLDTDTPELVFAEKTEQANSSLSFSNFSFSSLSSLLSDSVIKPDNIINNINPGNNTARTRTRGEPPKIDLSFIRPDFLPIVQKWLEYKKEERHEQYKTTSTLKTMYNNMLEYSGGDPKLADKIIQRAISNRSQGFYPINQNTKNNGATTQQHTEVSLDDGRVRKYVSTI